MKKLIAILLSVLMLVSCFAMGVSAARNYEKIETENSYWKFAEGQSYNPIVVDNQAGKDVELDIRFDLDGAGLKTGWANLAHAPVICLDGTIGAGTTTTTSSVTFTKDVWYHVLFDVDSANNKTDIYVDGTLAGSVAAIPTLYGDSDQQAFWQWDKISIDNFTVGDYFEDFEDITSFGTSGQGQLVVETTTGYNNYNEYDEKTGNKYYQWQASGAYWYMEDYVSDASAGYQLQFKVRLDDATSETRSYMGTDPIISTTKVGVGSTTQPVSLKTGEWYTVLYNSIAGSGTGIVVWDKDNSVVVETAVATNLGARPCMGAVLLSIDDLTVKDAGGNVKWSEDFNAGTFANKGDSNGVIVDETRNIKKDLGMKFWKFAEGNSYNPIEVGNQADKVVELDIRFDLDGAGLISTWTSLAKAPVIKLDGTVGVGDTTKKVDAFEKDTWYHVFFDVDASANSTAIYVDGSLVATVADVPSFYNNSQAFWAWDKISIDNFRVGDYFEDFENITTFGTSGQGALTEYDFPTAAETIFAKVDAQSKFSGTAYLAEPAYNSQYAWMGQSSDSLIDPDGTDYIITFTLALLPATAYGQSASDPYIEFWLNKACNRRVRIGSTFVGMQLNGESSDFVGYAWGDAVITNTHNVTIIYNNKSDKTSIYIDKELAWEGPCGMEWDDRLIGTVTNGSAVIDNLHIYDLQYNEKSVEIPTVDDGEWNAVNADAENFCAINGHITGVTTKTTEETCYRLGVLTTACSVCGEVAYTNDIDMIAHDWHLYPEYHTAKAATATEDGVAYWTCKASGCTAKIESNRILATDKYTGEIYADYDFENGEVMNSIQSGASFTTANGYSFEDGVLHINDGCDAPYHQFSDLGNTERGFTAAFQFKFDDTYDTKTTANPAADGGYGHSFYFWFGGSTGYANRASLDFDTNTAYIMSDNGAFATVSAPIDLDDGEWHNIVFRCRATNDEDFDNEDYGYATIEIDGEVVVSIEGEDAYWYLGENMGYIIIRDFGVACQIDNLTFGSHNMTIAFESKTVAGDINGDGKAAVSDLLLLRKIIANGNQYGLDLAACDLNGDGVLNAADVAALKKILKH